jgi:hypothetical protein
MVNISRLHISLGLLRLFELFGGVGAFRIFRLFWLFRLVTHMFLGLSCHSRYLGYSRSRLEGYEFIGCTWGYSLSSLGALGLFTQFIGCTWIIHSGDLNK